MGRFEFSSMLRRRSYLAAKTDSGTGSFQVTTYNGQSSLSVPGLQIGISPVIELAINPTSVKWTQQKRTSRRDVISGSVFFHYADEEELRNNDVLVLDVAGTTGNLMDKSKLRVWHDLYSLSREPVVTIDGLQNECTIRYSTDLIPDMLLFGFFSKPLEFSESADKPFMRDYSFSFTVIDSNPKLSELVTRF